MVVRADDADPNRPSFGTFRNRDGRVYNVDNSRSSMILAAGTCVRLYDLAGYGGQASTNVCATNGDLPWNLSRFDNRATSMKVCTTATQAACGPMAPSAPGPAPAPEPAPPAPTGPAALVPPGSRYVALGDSFSSGVGSRDYRLNRDCQRGPLAYPPLLESALQVRLTFRACGGARTGNVLDNQVQALTQTTQFVTISIGGNDIGFSDVVKQCAKPWPTTCWGDINDALDFIDEQLGSRLDRVYDAIRRRSPRALVVVVGYPRLFAGGNACSIARISDGEQSRLNAAGDRLAERIALEVRGRPNFRFADPRTAFDGHGVCGGDEWINGVSNPVGESYHPNAVGYRGLADGVLDRLGR